MSPYRLSLPEPEIPVPAPSPPARSAPAPPAPAPQRASQTENPLAKATTISSPTAPVPAVRTAGRRDVPLPGSPLDHPRPPRRETPRPRSGFPVLRLSDTFGSCSELPPTGMIPESLYENSGLLHRLQPYPEYV